MDTFAGTQLKLNLLLEASTLPSSLIPTKIKCNFRHICTVNSRNVKNLKAIPGKVCQYCLTRWDNENCRVKLKPAIKPGAKVRRILKKMKDKKKLTYIEKKLALRVNSPKNRLVTTCLVCNKSITKLYRKIKRKKRVPEVLTIEDDSIEVKDIDDSDIQIIEEKITPKKRREKEVADIIIMKSSKKKKKKKNNTSCSLLDSSTSATPTFVIDKIGNFSKRKVIVSPAVRSEGFIPLLSSTPTVKKKKRKYSSVPNPLHLKAIGTKRDEQYLKKRRLGLLEKLIDKDSQMVANPKYSLKNFLSNLN